MLKRSIRGSSSLLDHPWQQFLFSRIVGPQPPGQNTVTDILDRVKTALADRYMVEGEMGERAREQLRSDWVYAEPEFRRRVVEPLVGTER